MRTDDEIKEMVLQYVKKDTLYNVLKDTPREEILFSDTYLKDIVEKIGYPMTDIADWFNTSDGQLRYYLRPFYSYIFEEDGVISGNTSNVLRLNIRQILRLRMLILLKEEYRVKGLKQLLGLDGEGYIVQHQNSKERNIDPDFLEEMEEQLDQLTSVVTGIMKTGLFRLTDGPGGEQQVVLDNQRILQQMQLLVDGPDKKLMLVEDVNHIKEAQESLEAFETNLNKRREELDLMKEKTDANVAAASAKLNEIEEIQLLRIEALEEWKNTKKYGVWAKITKSDQIELERELFVKAYIEKHLKKGNEINDS